MMMYNKDVNLFNGLPENSRKAAVDARRSKTCERYTDTIVAQFSGIAKNGVFF